MPLLAWVVIVEWVIMIAAAVAFLPMIASPRLSADPLMSWHLRAMTVVAILQPVATFLLAWSLVPFVIVEGIAMVVTCWRTVLAVQTRRHARRGLRDLERLELGRVRSGQDDDWRSSP